MSTTENRASAKSPLEQEVAQGYNLLSQGRMDEAVELGDRLADAHGDNAPVLVFAAEASLAQGDPTAALERISQAITASHGNPFLKIKKARLLSQMRRRAEVPALAAEVSAQAGGNGHLLWQLGNLYYRSNLQADAIAHFKKAHALLGDHPGLLYDMAIAQFFSGDFEQAERDLDKMPRNSPYAGNALYLRATLRRQTPEHNHVEDIERRLKAGFASAENEAAALYALAKEQEDLGEHEKSFANLVAAASKKRGTLQYDLAPELDTLQAICDTYTTETMAAPTVGHDEEGAIFIVGMPRTGTTLVERLLVQSGKVMSAGELMDFGSQVGMATNKVLKGEPALSPAEASLKIDFASLGREYMWGARQAAAGSTMFIDKMPVNFTYCGLIRKALPNAKIIHLVRDPLDSCYAVFKTLFFKAYSFSFDMNELADYYIAYHRMMRHWHEAMPGQILDVHYEDLVTDTENQAKRIFDWCGLEWNPAVLETPDEKTVFATASAAQVREPVHSRSIHSSRRYREQLAPLAAKLVAAGIAFDR